MEIELTVPPQLAAALVHVLRAELRLQQQDCAWSRALREVLREARTGTMALHRGAKIGEAAAARRLHAYATRCEEELRCPDAMSRDQEKAA